MNCPICKVELKIADRQGVEIDYCPQCRGVWLDRGELDMIIVRSAHAAPPDPETLERSPGDQYRPPAYGKKKRPFLGDLFDFD